MNSINLVTQPSEDSTPLKEEILSKLNELVEKNYEEEERDSHGKDEDVKYDEDGFEIPKGKIPLDGNFSTKEIEGLVDLAKKENLLDENVEVSVLDPNEKIGDKIKISDSPESSPEASPEAE